MRIEPTLSNHSRKSIRDSISYVKLFEMFQQSIITNPVFKISIKCLQMRNQVENALTVNFWISFMLQLLPQLEHSVPESAGFSVTFTSQVPFNFSRDVSNEPRQSGFRVFWSFQFKHLISRSRTEMSNLIAHF